MPWKLSEDYNKIIYFTLMLIIITLLTFYKFIVALLLPTWGNALFKQPYDLTKRRSNQALLNAKMASIFEREPIFAYDRPWDDETKLPEKIKFSGTSGKAEVHVDSGSLGMEFF